MITTAISFLLLAAFAGTGWTAQDQDALEKRLKNLEAGHAAQEKRLAEEGDALVGTARRLKDLEKRLTDSEKDREGLLGRVRELEAGRAALEKKAAELEKGRKETASARDLEASRAALEQRLAESEKARLAGSARLAALETRLAESEKSRQETAARLQDLKAALAALDRRAGETDRDQEAARARLSRRLNGLEEETLELHARVALAENANRDDFEEDRRLGGEMREIKLRLLLSGYGCSDGGSPEGFYYPFQDHFAHLGAQYEYLGKNAAAPFGLKEGEGIRLRSVRPGSPAEAAGLRAGDAILRINGRPVTPSGLKGRWKADDRWVERAEMASYVTEHLPGETVELEVGDSEARRKVTLRFACRRCGEKCPFSNPQKGRP